MFIKRVEKIAIEEFICDKCKKREINEYKYEENSSKMKQKIYSFSVNNKNFPSNYEIEICGSCYKDFIDWLNDDVDMKNV